jgi:hypothetical protein
MPTKFDIRTARQIDVVDKQIAKLTLRRLDYRVGPSIRNRSGVGRTVDNQRVCHRLYIFGNDAFAPHALILSAIASTHSFVYQ